MRVITVNVNGIRAAVRRGGLGWLLAQQPDVVCMREVRASDSDLLKSIADAGFGDWDVAHAECSAKGRAGVAVATRDGHLGQRVGLDGQFVEQSRLGRGGPHHARGTADGRVRLCAHRRGRERAPSREVRLPRRDDRPDEPRDGSRRPATYAERWSDHAPVIVDYNL